MCCQGVRGSSLEGIWFSTAEFLPSKLGISSGSGGNNRVLSCCVGSKWTGPWDVLELTRGLDEKLGRISSP